MWYVVRDWDIYEGLSFFLEVTNTGGSDINDSPHNNTTSLAVYRLTPRRFIIKPLWSTNTEYVQPLVSTASQAISICLFYLMKDGNKKPSHRDKYQFLKALLYAQDVSVLCEDAQIRAKWP